MAFSEEGFYTWVFNPATETWSYVTSGALPFNPGDQIGNSSCGKLIFTKDMMVFNPKTQTGQYVNGKKYTIKGPDGKAHTFGWDKSQIYYDPRTRNYGLERDYGGSDPGPGIDPAYFAMLEMVYRGTGSRWPSY